MIRNTRAPADHGLSGLGLVMQLGGAVFGAITAVMGLNQLIQLSDVEQSGDAKLWTFVLVASGVARSIVHRGAGTQLLYGSEGRAAIRRYIWVGLFHTVVWLYFASSQQEASSEAMMTLAIVFAAWPLTLAAAMVFGPLEPLDGALPVPRDKGFDGLGTLMAVLGFGGLLYALVMLLTLVESSRGNRDGFEFQVFIALVIALIVRASLHVRAAVVTLTSRDLDRSTEAAARYGHAGMVTSVIAGVLLMMFFVKAEAPTSIALVTSGGVMAMLMAWPAAVRRFASERRFAGHGQSSDRFQLSTDGGLSALGWLLLGLGVAGMATALPAALWPGTRPMPGMTMFGATPQQGSVWWPVVMSGVQIWAAIELCGASERSRFAAMVYGAAAGAITLYLNLPVLRHLEVITGEHSLASVGGMSTLGNLALALIVPIATLVLAARQRPPIAPDVGHVFE